MTMAQFGVIEEVTDGIPGIGSYLPGTFAPKVILTPIVYQWDEETVANSQGARTWVEPDIRSVSAGPEGLPETYIQVDLYNWGHDGRFKEAPLCFYIDRSTGQGFFQIF